MSLGYSALFFFLGVFSYIIFSKVLQITSVINLIPEINFMAISLLQYAEEICEKTFAMSRNKMRSSKDFTEQEMAKVEETDNAIMNDWRSECVEKFFSFYPKNVVKNLPFKTWDEAILWARRFEKEKKL